MRHSLMALLTWNQREELFYNYGRFSDFFSVYYISAVGMIEHNAFTNRHKSLQKLEEEMGRDQIRVTNGQILGYLRSN